MAYQAPISSATGGIDFGRLSSEDVKKLSVKRIHVTPTLDSMFGPMPGGVHDLALGAINALDANCTTCRTNAAHCPGHCGHIELPQQCYHPLYIDTTLRLLRSKCIFCHHFRLPVNLVHYTVCQLRLLHHGLVKDFLDLARYRTGSKRKRLNEGDMEVDGIDAEEDIDALMDRRERFVDKCIRKAERRAHLHVPFAQNAIAIQSRKDVITEFLQQVSMVKKCARCVSYSPSYRKDKNTKIFRLPLPKRAREEMAILSRKPPNPLIYLLQERKEKELAKKALVNGDSDKEMTDVTHGAEEEIALSNALETTASSKNAELEDGYEVQAYMTPAEVHAALTLLFEREQQIMSLLFSPLPGRKYVPVTADIFFMTNVLVPPNKFRPLARQGQNQMMEAQMNSGLNKIVNAANSLKSMMRNAKRDDADARKPTHAQFMAAGITLQETVNALIDNPSPPSGRPVDQGIKQVLEKKEGLFRMNMMGKRVNFAARSVISPDPNIETNEIGVPLVFAKKLTYPEPVGSHNFEALSRAVINGCDEYPGASAVENEFGQVMSLKRKSKDARRALARQLLTAPNGYKGDNPKKVYRHLITGDVVIMNRQPTLHKPSMMGHKARVLQNEKTIRMHYANCNTYNADFDGDEMNMHFLQNELARAEALNIADTDHQYLSATAGKPLRGLIQDHISMGVQFTSRDIFLDKEEYQELLYNCLRPESGHIMYDRIQLVQPAIIKPKMLWTGKQVITTILKNIIPPKASGLNLTSKSQTAADRWGEKTLKPEDQSQWSVKGELMAHRDTEQVVIFRDGDHLSGILDKAQMGPAVGGLVHSIYEVYGHIVAGKLLSVLGRLLTRFLNERAWSCGIDDLYLTKEGDRSRSKELEKAPKIGHDVSVGYVQLKRNTQQGSQELINRLEGVLRDDDQLNTLDQLYNASTKSITDGVSKAVMPKGLRKPFPRNQMQAMTISGAKGSGVNANLISCNLGQQVLEGRRVPIMVSGKTLPLYRAFETHPTAGGYVTGRFLTGIKPPEYFFHAMSGREGLIDTAVKTAKSGYLQRCIIKGLEGLRTEYDTSVREASTGTIVQFLYGEDGLEVAKQKHLTEFPFLIENVQSISVQLKAQEQMSRLEQNAVMDVQKEILKRLRRDADIDPVTTLYPPASHFGSTSESFAQAVNTYSRQNPDKLLRDKTTSTHSVNSITKRTFEKLMNLKYMRSIVDAGEAIGVVAAQSVGEPSTQMTLNTFHLAGHSAKNVTLGIPRLREIIMTASPKMMTPTMTIKPIPDILEQNARQFAKAISRLPLSHVINKMSVTEQPGPVKEGMRQRIYEIKIEFYDPEEYTQEYAIKIADIGYALETRFLPTLYKKLQLEFKKKEKEASLSQATAAVPEIGVSVGRVEEEQRHGTRTAEREGGEDDIDSDADMDDARDAAARARREDDFDEPDDDEAELEKSSDEEEDGEDGDAEMTNAEKIKKGKKTPQTQREQNPDDSGDEQDSANDTEDFDTEEEISRERRQKAVQDKVKSLTHYHFSLRKGRKARITLSYDANKPKLLLLPILEHCARGSVIQAVPGLNLCSLSIEDVQSPDGKNLKRTNPATGAEEDVKEQVITCQGVNLLAMREENCQTVINPHSIRTNSPYEMLRHYGVEACRATIVQEIAAVFKSHGISVDLRHISLIADAMTQSGGYKAFSRHGIVKEGGSVLAKMSFETVMGFLKEAVMFGERDLLLGPSARIVAGRRGNIGTGSFDVVMPAS